MSTLDDTKSETTTNQRKRLHSEETTDSLVWWSSPGSTRTSE